MARRRRRGIVHGDRRFHAVVLKLRGPWALCDAGRIVLTLEERFDPDDRLACPDCAAMTQAQVR
ncbi:MAG TPA: hypothetical protein VG650_03980 [Mycobacteriales bacterium]|nr:hypothetical protein [Mycobacteriales bacterium]